MFTVRILTSGWLTRLLAQSTIYMCIEQYVYVGCNMASWLRRHGEKAILDLFRNT